ncbi:MAG: hypothetical protein A3F90_14710 [Deltaproteobacteria bacterium RIFCSPLOWO2_12_FULL_60_19]|nr:MAG: hypothetical protein A3F90_14710 [Deltaproteobacteria bacterium RIFCSPLOWO2_12_FULL_60_19]
MDHAIDPITLSTVWHSMQSACREVRHVIDRTSQNFLIAQLHDVSAGIWDARARTISIPAGLPVQFMAAKFSIKAILDKFAGRIYPGDVFLTNDPYKGHCCHLPDWGFYRPVFYGDELLFFTLARAHQMDTGGSYPGGYFPNGYDIHAEGLIIPPIKVFERGVEREDIFDLIWNNVRWPEGVRVDNYALIAATKICEQRILGLIEKYGKETVLGCVEEMLARTEKAVREEIRKMPDGVYTGESATDDDGSELGVPVWVKCKLTISGDRMSVDFSESDKQRKGFVNAVFASTYSNTLASVFLFLDPALSDYHNEGSMTPIQLVTQEGSVVHARYPATVGASPVNVGTQIMESVVMAMSKAMPKRAVAAWGRHYSHFIYGFDPRVNQPYVQVLFEPDGGSGAVYGYDGYEGVTMLVTLGEAVKGDVETIEVRFPWTVEKYEFAPDSAGAGRWRGAAGIHWEMVNHGSPAGMSTGNAEGETVHGLGALGGLPAPFNQAHIRRNGETLPLRAHRIYSLSPEDRVVKVTGGGGGVGPPLEREPEKVREDVLDGFITIGSAREIYGVVIDAQTRELDLKATATLRREMKKATAAA